MAVPNPMRCWDEILSATSQWTIGASGAHTKTANIPGTMFTGVARTAAGKYTVTFARGVPVGPFLELIVTAAKAADAETTTARWTLGTYTAETAAAAATVKYESWEIDETAAQVDFASGDIVTLTARWLKTK